MGTINADFYLKAGIPYWSLSPRVYTSAGNAGGVYVDSAGGLYSADVGSTIGLRPVISLKLGTSIVDGDGTSTNPYIVK